MASRISPFPLPTLLAALAAAGAAGGQCPTNSGGPLVGAPFMGSVDPTTALVPAQPERIVLKNAGFQSVPPVPLEGDPARPDFGATAMWYPSGRACNPTGVIDVDAISLGLDWVPSDGSGVVYVGPGNVAMMVFSVTRGTLGRPGSVVECERLRPAGAAGDVFSYVFRSTGTNFPGLEMDVVRLACASDEIALPSPLPGPRPNIDGLDVFAALYDLMPQAVPFLPPAPTVYFSLSAATTGLVPPSWWLKGAIPTAASGASILETTWDPVLRRWSCPSVYLAFSDLHLIASDDVDALGLDLQQGYVLFSTTALSPRAPDPLMFGNLGLPTVATSVFRYSATETVASRLDIEPGTGDLDAVCPLDPGGNPLRQRDYLVHAYGLLQNQVLPFFPQPPSAAAYRMRLGNRDVLRTFTVGGPRPGVDLMFFSPPFPLNQFQFWFNPIAVVAGNAGTFRGLPTVLDLTIPSNTAGVVFDLHWADISQSFQQNLARPVEVKL